MTAFLIDSPWWVVGVPLAFSLVLYLVVWAIRWLRTERPSETQFFDLEELREALSTEAQNDPEAYKTEIEPALDTLKTKYGNRVPVEELADVQRLVRGKIASIREKKQKIIDKGAARGDTISIEALRQNFDKRKALYEGADREAYVQYVEQFLESLTAKHGSHIPVDEAYKMQQSLEKSSTDTDAPSTK